MEGVFIMKIFQSRILGGKQNPKAGNKKRHERNCHRNLEREYSNQRQLLRYEKAVIRFFSFHSHPRDDQNHNGGVIPDSHDGFPVGVWAEDDHKSPRIRCANTTAFISSLAAMFFSTIMIQHTLYPYFFVFM